jgi:UDP-N-acetylglucosamine 2-epimerase
MHDLVARISTEVRDPAILAEIGHALAAAAPGLELRPGGYLFATIHRQENREPAAMARWASLLAAAARPDRPVVLALHPGTRRALAGAGIELGRDVVVVRPQGYRTSLALQLHAAAVLTDSGGIQREAAWLGTPCLVLRDTTEWTEAVADSNGRMVVVGLDAGRLAAELARLAPVATAPATARARSASLRIEAPRAADAISALLEG